MSSEFESVWDYRFPEMEVDGKRLIGVGKVEYYFMAAELADRISDVYAINPDMILFDKESEFLASIIGSLTRPKVISELFKDKVYSGKNILIVSNENKDGSTVKEVNKLKTLFPDIEFHTSVLFENERLDECEKADFVVKRTTDEVYFSVSLKKMFSKQP